MKQKRSTNRSRPKGRIPKARRHPVHKRVMLHPLWVFGMLCLGVVLISATVKTTAADYTVSAVVPAAPLTEAAVITLPTNGTTTSTSPLDVEGTCPANSYVKLVRNGFFSGAAICDAQQRFRITTDLTVGGNNLQAQAYNITDTPGPVGNMVTVYYDLPIVPAGSSNSSSAGVTSSREEANTPAPQLTNYPLATATTPLLLLTPFTYQAFRAGQEFSWEFDVSGGKAPYTVNTNWGDSTTSNYTFTLGQKFAISHRYAKPGNYAVKVSAVDANANRVLFQIAAVIKPYGKSATSALGALTPVTPGGTRTGAATIDRMPTWLLFSWPAYGVIILMTISFWLGERQEVFQLSHFRRTKKRQTAR